VNLPDGTAVVITWVDRLSQGAAGIVTATDGTQHQCGHLRTEGWFCTCPRGKRCRHINTVKSLVPPMELLP